MTAAYGYHDEAEHPNLPTEVHLDLVKRAKTSIWPAAEHPPRGPPPRTIPPVQWVKLIFSPSLFRACSAEDMKKLCEYHLLRCLFDLARSNYRTG